MAVGPSDDPDFAQPRSRAEHEARVQESDEVDAQGPTEDNDTA